MYNRNLTVANVLSIQSRIVKLNNLLEKGKLSPAQEKKLDKELFWLERKVVGR